jgi:PAS domain S-box-containing protein
LTTKKKLPDRAAGQHRQTEEKAWHNEVQLSEDLAALPPEEIRQILHGLKDHQIELTMQSEKLRAVNAELDASRARYFDLYDLAPVGYCTVSEKGLILEANLTAAALLNVSRGELVNQSVSSFILKEDLDIYYLHRKQLFETGEPQECELRMVKKDCLFFWARLKGIVSQDENGLAVCRVVLSDITGQKRAEEALLESEERYRRIIETITDYVYTVQIEKGKAVTTKHGPGCLAVTGYKEGEFDQDPFLWLRMVPAEDHEQVIGQSMRAAAGEKCVPIEHRIVRKDGQTRWVRNTPVFLRDRNEIVTGYDGLIQDITEFKKMVEQLHQAQKMEAIGVLAGGIAHDFNNILFPIIGYTEMMLDNAPEGSDLKKGLNEVLLASGRARELVQQILSFSRQSEKELRPVKMQIIVREAIKLAKSSIPSTIEIRQDIDKKCNMVIADPTNIHQIVMNLITNAYHAMESDGGTMTIQLSEVNMTAEDLSGFDLNPGTFACLSVSDTGHGIEKSVLSRIFEPYFTTKPEGKGTGLGLSVVHGIVRGCNGSIRVSSEPGKGSVFSIYLPVFSSGQEKETHVVRPSIQGGDEHILLVDDEEQILKMEKQMLEQLGYRITMLTSSVEALEAFRVSPDKFDLVITDMTMPNMTGDKLAFAIKHIRKETPVIICTGFSERISREGTEALGIEGFLMKPVVKSDLACKIRTLLDVKKKG